jgi:hypothetical protein
MLALLEAFVKVLYETFSEAKRGWCWCGHEMKHHTVARCPLEGCCCDRPRRIR